MPSTRCCEFPGKPDLGRMAPGLAKAAPLTPSPRHLDGLRANVAVGLLEARDGAVAQAPDHRHQRVEVLKLQQLLGDKGGEGQSLNGSRIWPSSYGEETVGSWKGGTQPGWQIGEGGNRRGTGTSATWTKCVMTRARCGAVGLLRIMSWTHCETLLKREMNRSRTGLSTVQP